MLRRFQQRVCGQQSSGLGLRGVKGAGVVHQVGDLQGGQAVLAAAEKVAGAALLQVGLCDAEAVVRAAERAQALAGLACGVGGGCEMLGMYSAFKWVTAPGPGFGWDGIIVATLAGNNPALVPLGAFFLAYMRVGADIMTRMTDVQNEIVSIIQGVVIILIVAKRFLGKWERRAIFKEATANAKHGEEATS